MNEDHINKSLPEVLGDYARLDTARFHMPGHKGRKSEFPFGIDWDVTEIYCTDDLHSPTGAILETELAYTRVYSSKHSFPVVGGSTLCVHTMMLAIGEHKRVLMARDAHKSAIAGAALAGHELSFVYPEGSSASYGMVSASAVDSALSASPADAVFIVSPNYYGMCSDIRKISEVCRRHGALLLIDAAHAAHFPFSAALPDFPADCVDMWCVSTHKTLCAVTQTAVLSIGVNSPFEVADIRRVLSVTETSSPSYMLMASLSWALHSVRERTWDAHVTRIQDIRERIESINGLKLYSLKGALGIFDTDVTRLCIDVTERGITGSAASDALIAMGVVPEMADAYCVVLITTPADPGEWYERLVRALSLLPYGTREAPPRPVLKDLAGERVTGVREAVLSKADSVPLESCAGLISASAVGTYPPGTAVLFPGETIKEAAVRYLADCQASGISLFGTQDGCVNVLHRNV